MALVPGIHERLLSDFKDEVCQNPDTDFVRIAAVADKFREQENKRFSGVFFGMLLELYERDIQSLTRDLLKIKLLGRAKATPSQRVDLLRCLYGAASFYIQDGFSELIAMCEEIEDAYRMEDGSPELGSI